MWKNRKGNNKRSLLEVRIKVIYNLAYSVMNSSSVPFHPQQKCQYFYRIFFYVKD